jgi:hypothetical protein
MKPEQFVEIPKVAAILLLSLRAHSQVISQVMDCAYKEEKNLSADFRFALIMLVESYENFVSSFEKVTQSHYDHSRKDRTDSANHSSARKPRNRKAKAQRGARPDNERNRRTKAEAPKNENEMTAASNTNPLV